MSIDVSIGKDVAGIIGQYLQERYLWLFETSAPVSDNPIIIKTFTNDRNDAIKRSHDLIISGNLKLVFESSEDNYLVYDTVQKRFARFKDNESYDKSRYLGPPIKNRQPMSFELFELFFITKDFQLKLCKCMNE